MSRKIKLHNFRLGYSCICLLLIISFPNYSFASSGENLYEQAMHRVRALSNSDNVRLLPFGRSQEGRPLPAFVISDFRTDPKQKARILICAGQHGDEANPLKTLLSLAGQLASGAYPELLSSCAIIVIPMVNPDGIARCARTNALGFDINRDWLSLKTPECRFVDSIIALWKPHVLLDLHEWTGPSPIPGDSIEIAPCVRNDQAVAMREMATAIAAKSKLTIIRCKTRGNSGMFHRRYVSAGYAAFLVETSSNASQNEKDLAYRSVVIAAAHSVGANLEDRKMLSPASERFCLSVVSPYLAPPLDLRPPVLSPVQAVVLAAAICCLLIFLARPSNKNVEAVWSRRFRKCSVDVPIATNPLLLRRALRPITCKSWVNRELRARYSHLSYNNASFSKQQEREIVA
jgi:hypothetical protein